MALRCCRVLSAAKSAKAAKPGASKRVTSFMVAATGQHVGKTTTSLALVAGAVKRLGSDKVAYMKPVGQQWVEVDLLGKGKHRVDKDCVLFKEFFGLGCEYPDMSPILIPKGFTQQYLDGKTPGLDEHTDRIRSYYARLKKQSDCIIVEGTGHAGVGSVIGLNNAQVAQALGIPAVLIGPGGIGSSTDELCLSKNLFEAHGVKIKGVIVNKVRPEKIDKVTEYMRKQVEGKWKIPLLGVVPFNTMLHAPTMNDVALVFNSKFIAGEDRKFQRIADVQLIATCLDAFTEQKMYNRPQQLYVVPSGRTDIILAIIADLKVGGLARQSGLVLTGDYPPQEQVLQTLRHESIPALHLSDLTSFEVCSKLATFKAKIRMEDKEKIQKAVDVIQDAIDYKTLLEAT
eukprot:TRINITY_DN3134_c4_g1_i1.p1 TRINITY_DN3134_c4_g1~~TRINITY_DN3134_c4_g1_i1.p1  ORF type:complete len:400 (+),score=120.01 TRINITY_DN3134_c4_g1_i1:100-1299(+)